MARPRLPPPVGSCHNTGPEASGFPLAVWLLRAAGFFPVRPGLSSVVAGWLGSRNPPMDRVFGSCIPGMEAAADRDEEGLELSLSLHPSPSSPPRFQAVFACCYCPRKFRSSQALGGHQNAHKLQRNLARRGREAASAPPAPPPQPPPSAADQGNSRASGSLSAPAPRSRAEPAADAWGEGRHRRQHHLHQGLAGGAEASSGARGNGDDAEEIIDLSLKL